MPEAVVVLAYLYLAAISVTLAIVDVRTHRLPNRIVLPAYAVLAVLFTLACLLGVPWTALLRAAVGGAVLFAFYALLRALPPGGMGGGDVKLAGVLGIALGFVGWGALLLGALAGFLLGGIYGMALMAARRADRKTAIPFGPWMIAGAWLGIALGAGVGVPHIGPGQL